MEEDCQSLSLVVEVGVGRCRQPRRHHHHPECHPGLLGLPWEGEVVDHGHLQVVGVGRCHVAVEGEAQTLPPAQVDHHQEQASEPVQEMGVGRAQDPPSPLQTRVQRQGRDEGAVTGPGVVGRDQAPTHQAA